MRNFKNSPGRLFSVNFSDETSEIKATMFNDVADEYEQVFQVGSMYVISGTCTIKIADRKYAKLKHLCEMSLNKGSHVVKVDDVATVPQVLYDFISIEKIADLQKDEIIDTIGIILSVSPVYIVSTKSGDVAKRVISIADDTNYKIDLTIWNSQAQNFEQDILKHHGDHPVLAAKCVRVGEYNGKSLSAIQSTILEINPVLEITERIKIWLSETGVEGLAGIGSLSSSSVPSSSSIAPSARNPQKTLSHIHLEGLGHQSTPDTIVVYNLWTGQFNTEGRNLWYPACLNQNCKGKKVFEEGGNMRCPACNGVNNFKLRWISNLKISDATGSEFASGFGDVGTKLVGCEAESVQQLQSDGNTSAISQIFETARFKQYNMKLAVKHEVYNDVAKIKVSIQSVEPVDYVADSKRLLDQIALMSQALTSTV